MGPIGSFSGLASGIQWRDMIDEIVQLDRARQVSPLATQVTTQHSRLDSWRQFRTQVAKLSTAARTLKDGTPFDAFRVSISGSPAGRTLVSATASATATPGNYSVEVLGLARAEKLGSAVRATATESLGLTGRVDGEDAPLPLTFSINGQEIEVGQSASLNQIRDAINQANSGSTPTGVSATVLTTSPGEHRLILTAEKTGTAGIRLGDGEDGVLGQLGIHTDSRSVQISGAMDGDPPSVLAPLLGLTPSPESRTIVIDGREIEVDLATDTLSSLMDKVRAAASVAGGDPETAARIVTEADANGQPVHRLEVRGSVVGKWDDAETAQIMNALGFSRENSITAGSDAQFRIDGFALTRRTNTVSDALSGVTLNLQQAELGTVLDMRISRDADRTVEAVKAFTTAYNDLVGFVRQASAPGQPLANNSTLKSAMSSFTGLLLADLEGTDSQPIHFARATLVGVSLSRTGTLEIDEVKLKAALAANPEDVRRLFSGYEDGPEGLAGRFTRVAESITRSGNGLVAGQTESLERSIDNLTNRVSAAESRLELRRESLVKQFTRMEEALAKIQAQGAWLESQIQAMQPRRDR